MQVGGFNQEIDYARLGPTLVLTAGVILAIRTARRDATRSTDASYSNREWEAEIDCALVLANMILSRAVHRHQNKFTHKDVPWHVPNDEDMVP